MQLTMDSAKEEWGEAGDWLEHAANSAGDWIRNVTGTPNMRSDRKKSYSSGKAGKPQTAVKPAVKPQKGAKPAVRGSRGTMPFNVVQYNLFGRPYIVSHDGQNERLQRIPSALLAVADVDVITFAEADNDHEVQLMATAFAAAGFRYRTTVVTDHDDASLLNGGVIIGSRWPILREDQIVYRDACSGTDCLAAKGVKYARVIKSDAARNVSKVFNIFGTHMQAWYSKKDKAARVKQAQQFRSFIDSQEIPVSEPVIIAGDFNSDLVRYPGEVKALLATLDATMPTLRGSVKFTSDPISNLLVGRDGAAHHCKPGYKESWGPEVQKTYSPNASTRVATQLVWPPATDTGEPLLPFFGHMGDRAYCPCCPSEWIDYILTSNRHQQPDPAHPPPTLVALAIKTAPVKVPWSGMLEPVAEPSDASSYMNLVDLSDHYPVFSQFHFAVLDPQSPVSEVDGCRKDSDCAFHPSIEASCFCVGPGCVWHGRHRNGWKAGASHPVNANCHFHPLSVSCVCHKDDAPGV